MIKNIKKIKRLQIYFASMPPGGSRSVNSLPRVLQVEQKIISKLLLNRSLFKKNKIN
jgi:hypothetical protein